jgi:catalase
MVTKKKTGPGGGTKQGESPGNPSSAKGSVSGSRSGQPAVDPASRQKKATQDVAAQFAANPNKAAEYGRRANKPKPGPTAVVEEIASASTLTEETASDKAGSKAKPGDNPTNRSLDRVRVDAGGQTLTTNFGQPIADNQSSLKLGLRGPALLEDFVLREKITHFDHERIPERIVHARGSGAHGVFECYEPLTRYTKASFLAEAGKHTPVFVRFSTVAGERGSTDTPRDVRGFATKFYTDEGNFDIVGNNIPVFFIQDAINPHADVSR